MQHRRIARRVLDPLVLSTARRFRPRRIEQADSSRPPQRSGRRAMAIRFMALLDAWGGGSVPGMAAHIMRRHNGPVNLRRSAGRALSLAVAGGGSPRGAGPGAWRIDARPGAARGTAGMALRPGAAHRRPWLLAKWPTCGPGAGCSDRHPSQPAAALAKRRSPGRVAAMAVALRSPIEAYEGPAVQRPHGAAHAAGAGRRTAAAAGRADDAGAAGRLTGRARGCWPCCTAARGGPDLPAAGLGAVRRGELGLAFQHAVRPGAGDGRCTTCSTRPSWSRRCCSGGRWSAPIQADGASPTLSASSISSWPCRRTRSWAWR